MGSAPATAVVFALAVVEPGSVEAPQLVWSGEAGHSMALENELAELVRRALASASSAPAAQPAPATLRREGEYWTLSVGDSVVHVRDCKGLRQLAILIAQPGVERHALDLAREVCAERAPRSPAADLHVARDPGDAGELLDPVAKAAYKARLEELRCEADEADAFGDGERAFRAREEIAFIARELSAAVGLGGRDRRACSHAERARVSVTRCIRSAIAKIAEHDSSLGRHLQSSVRTGTFCVYDPGPESAGATRLQLAA